MVVNRQRRVPVAVKPLEGFLRRVQHTLRLPAHDVTICLLGDAAMARLNQAFRGKRGPTDVLSFPANGMRRRRGIRSAEKQRPGLTAEERRKQRSASGPAAPFAASRSSFTSSPSSPPYLGDIAISLQAARRNARRFARPLPQELRLLILHGMLHLAGYDHETDHGEMDRIERRLRRRLGLS